MRRDEDWWDATGKDLWRWEQELAEMERSKAVTNKPVESTDGVCPTHAVPEVRE